MDVQLSNGRGLTGDLTKISIKQYRRVLDKDQPQDEEDEFIGMVFGLTKDEVQALSYPDYRRVTRCFFQMAMAPLDDGDKKNSESVST
jgi:hypothetical protein